MKNKIRFDSKKHPAPPKQRRSLSQKTNPIPPIPKPRNETKAPNHGKRKTRHHK